MVTRRRYSLNIGLTWVELMMAMSLSMVLMLALITVFLSSNHYHQFQSELLDNHYNTNIALHILKNEIAQAGFTGCTEKLTQEAVRFSENTITVQHRRPEASRLLKEIKGIELYLTGEIKILPRQMLLVTDCKNRDIVMIDEVYRGSHSQKVTLAVPLKNHYEVGIIVGIWEINAFYIEKELLYERNSRGQKRVLAEGIQKLVWLPNVLRENRLQQVEVNDLQPTDIIKGVALSIETGSKNEYTFGSCC